MTLICLLLKQKIKLSTNYCRIITFDVINYDIQIHIFIKTSPK